MNDLSNICCICIKPNSSLQYLHSISSDTITYYEKLTTSLIDMCLDRSAEYKICIQCCNDINLVYEFHKKCLSGKKEFAILQARLQHSTTHENKYNINNINANASIHDEDSLSLNINEIVTTELQIKCEVHDIDLENNDSNLENYDTDLENNYQDSSLDAVEQEITDPAASLSLLPEKSRKTYEKVYNRFKRWLEKKNIKELNEATMLKYFIDKSKYLKSSTLWSEYSMLKATLAVKDDFDIQRFPQITAFLKRKSIGYLPQQSHVVTREQFNKFIEQAPDDKYLLMKVIAIFGFSGGCTRDELQKMTIDDIVDNNSHLEIQIPHFKTTKPRSFTINNTTEINIYRKYNSLRPHQVQNDRFFVQYRNKKCCNQVVGVHSFSKIPCEIAKFLGLENPSQYTAHCFRRSAILKKNSYWSLSTVNEDVNKPVEKRLKKEDKPLPWTTLEVVEEHQQPNEEDPLTVEVKTESPGPTNIYF